MDKADQYLAETRLWLNKRFDVFDENGWYVPNQPSYGFSALAFRLEEYARSFALLRVLNRLSFDSYLDIGSADGYFADLVHRLFQSDVTGGDLSDRALVRAKSLHGLSGCSVDAHKLPFPDNAFDVVAGSEMLEHVSDPGQVISEMNRVARKYVIVTTPRAPDDATVDRHFDSLDPGEPHAHIHYFTDTAIRVLCGSEATYLGARSKWINRLMDRLAWGSNDSLAQRQAYLEFTLVSTSLTETSREAVRQSLIGRYENGPGWRQWIAGRRCMAALLKLDGLLAERKPARAFDHMVIIPKGINPVSIQPRLTEKHLLRELLWRFSVPPLQADPS
jgi:SAM-dependent methyltransferase